MSDSSANPDNSPMTQDGIKNNHGRGHGRHPWHMRFTEDELRVFKECKRESMMYRALPLATLFGIATFVAVKQGYLKPNARLGAAPKVILASLLGYGTGKFSYRKTCMKKMIELPNSRFGQFLKEKDGRCGPWGGPREGLMMFEAGANPRDMYWGAGRLPTDPSPVPATNEQK